MKTFGKAFLEKAAPPFQRTLGRWPLRERTMSPVASAGERAGGASSPPQAGRGMRSPGTVPAAAAEDAPGCGGRRCQPPDPRERGISLPPLGRCGLQFELRDAPPEATPSRLGHAPTLSSEHPSGPSAGARAVPPPPVPSSAPASRAFPLESPEAPGLGPAPNQSPAPGAPPRSLKSHGLPQPQSRARGVGRC